MSTQPILYMIVEDNNIYEQIASALESICFTPTIIYFKGQTEFFNYIDDMENNLLASNHRTPSVIFASLESIASELDGFIEKVKSQKATQFIPLVIMCRDFSEQEERRAYQNGVSSIIRYPYKYESLLELLNVFDKYWFNSVLLP